MMLSDFKESFTGVVSAFGSKTDEGRAAVYFKTFSHLNGDQWQALCEWGVASCDRFPTIKELYRGMFELNLVARPKLSDLDKDTLTVVCVCGASFVFSRLNQPSTYHCPGEGCHTSYDSEYVMREADRYGVLWADREIRDALRSTVTKAQAMKAVYEFPNAMHKDVEASVTRKKTLKEIRAIEQPKTPPPEAMFEKSFTGHFTPER